MVVEHPASNSMPAIYTISRFISFYSLLLLFPEDKKFAQAVHFATKHKTDSGFRYFPVEHTLVVLVIEHTDIARTGRIKAVLKRNIVDKRFRIIRGIGAGCHLTADDNLHTVVEKTLRIAEAIIRLLVTRFG